MNSTNETDPLERSLLRDLISATEAGDLQRIRELLGLDIRPDVVDSHSGLSGLHAAVMSCPDAVDLMLRHCKDPDLPKLLGGTPLSYVIHELGESPAPEERAKLLQVLHSLLNAGANPQAGSSDQNPLALARLYGFGDVESMLNGYVRGEQSSRS